MLPMSPPPRPLPRRLLRNVRPWHRPDDVDGREVPAVEGRAQEKLRYPRRGAPPAPRLRPQHPPHRGHQRRRRAHLRARRDVLHRSHQRRVHGHVHHATALNLRRRSHDHHYPCRPRRRQAAAGVRERVVGCAGDGELGPYGSRDTGEEPGRVRIMLGILNGGSGGRDPPDPDREPRVPLGAAAAGLQPAQLRLQRRLPPTGVQLDQTERWNHHRLRLPVQTRARHVQQRPDRRSQNHWLHQRGVQQRGVADERGGQSARGCGDRDRAQPAALHGRHLRRALRDCPQPRRRRRRVRGSRGRRCEILDREELVGGTVGSWWIHLREEGHWQSIGDLRHRHGRVVSKHVRYAWRGYELWLA